MIPENIESLMAGRPLHKPATDRYDPTRARGYGPSWGTGRQSLKNHSPPTKKFVPRVYCSDTQSYEDLDETIKVGHSHYKKRKGKLNINFCLFRKHGTTFMGLFTGKKLLDIITFVEDVTEKEAHDTVFGDVSSFFYADTKINDDKKYYTVKLVTRMITQEKFDECMQYNSHSDKTKQGTKSDSAMASIVGMLKGRKLSIRLRARFPDIAMNLARSVARRQVDRKFNNGRIQIAAYYPNFHTGVGMITHNEISNVYPLFFEYNKSQ